MNIKRYGFTLAELLIAMVVIGVIAALTVPVLLSNIFARSYAAQAKNMAATIEQLAADELVDKKTRLLSSTDFAAVNDLLRNDGNDHFEIVSVCAANCNAPGGYFSLNNHGAAANQFNGRTITLKNGAKLTYIFTGQDNWYGSFTVDVNGDDKPNTIGRDVFGFVIDIHGHLVLPNNPTVEQCRNDADPQICAAVLMNNAWQIPDDM